MHNSHNSAKCFSLEGVYPCPVCRVGEISALSLMDAMACHFCRHIFTVNVEKQRLQMADRQPPLIWRWNGRMWVGAHLQGVEFGWTYWVASAVFILLPSTLMGFAAYAFPPLPDSPLSWLPTVWTGLTFFSHLTIVGWLVIEFYQFPVVAYLRAMRQRLTER